MKSDKTKTEDHRVRVGAQRREKTRLKLLESALTVVQAKSVEMAVIDDFIAAAGVSRGTFYNYYNTTTELLLSLASQMSDEALGTIDPLVLEHSNPVERFTTGTRLYMHVATLYPLWGAFLNRVGTRVATRGQLIEKYLTRDLTDARKAGLIEVADLLVARDMVLGSIFYGIETMVSEPTHAQHPEQLMYSVLVGLRVPDKEARRVAFLPLELPKVVKGPIFSRLTPMRKKTKATERDSINAKTVVRTKGRISVRSSTSQA